MTIQQRLHLIRIRESEIERIREMIAEHMSQLEPQSPRYDSSRVQTTPENRTEAAILQVQAETERLQRLKARQSAEKGIIRSHIETMDNRAYRDVITLFYMARRQSAYHGLTLPMRWADVASKMGYSASHCKRLHRLAVDALEKTFKA